MTETNTQQEMKDFLKHLLNVLALEIESGRTDAIKAMAIIPHLQELNSLEEINQYLEFPPTGFEFLKEINFSQMKTTKTDFEQKVQLHMSKMIQEGHTKEATDFYAFAMNNRDDLDQIKNKYPTFSV